MAYMKREERKEQILATLTVSLHLHGMAKVSTKYLARACGVVPSTAFRSILWELYDEGKIQVHDPIAQEGKRYYPAQSWYWSLPIADRKDSLKPGFIETTYGN